MRVFTEEDLGIEIWEDLINFEDYYQVSTLGRFKRKKRKGLKELILTLGYYSNGYEQFSVTIDKKRYTAIAHRLVAKQFIPNPENKPEVNHKNGIKDDNRKVNLEWNTESENIKHSIDILGKITPKGNDCIFSKLTEEKVKEIVKLRKKNKLSFRKLATLYDVSYSTIQSIFSKRTWKHLKYERI